MAGRKGAIAFGLVYIPVELYPATQDDAVRFNQLAKESMQRVRYVKTCPDCNRELGPDDIVRGYQYEKGKYVVVDDEELDAIKTDADRAMKIVQFSDIDEVPPLYFEKPYQVRAQPGGEKALELLRRAMVDEGKIAIGTTVLGNSETPIEKRLEDKDKRRRLYYKRYTGRDWGMAQNYHLSLDSGAIGEERCRDIICSLYQAL